MKRLLKIIPKEKLSVLDGISLPISKNENIVMNKKNLSVYGRKKDIDKFIFQSLIYLPLAYNLNEFNIVLIDFNEANKELYPLSSLDSIKYIFLDSESMNLSIFFDNIDKEKKTLFFIVKNENIENIVDYEFLLEDTLNEMYKNNMFNVIELSYFEKASENTLTKSIDISNKKFAIEKDFIPDFFLKINQDINTSLENPMNYRRNRQITVNKKQLF